MHLKYLFPFSNGNDFRFFSGERMCAILVKRLEDKACPVNVWIGKLTMVDMIPLG